MVLVNHLGLIQPSHVECVAVRVLVAYDNVHGLLRVPAQRGTLVLQVDFLEGCLAAQVVEDETPVVADGGEQGRLGRVELALGDRVHAPGLEGLDWCRALIVPDLDDGACGREDVLRVAGVAAQ